MKVNQGHRYCYCHHHHQHRRRRRRRRHHHHHRRRRRHLHHCHHHHHHCHHHLSPLSHYRHLILDTITSVYITNHGRSAGFMQLNTYSTP